jgi:hypothetical protein
MSVNLSVKVTVGDQHLNVDFSLMTECGLSAPLSIDQSERCSLVNPNTGRVERSRRLESELSVNVSVNLSVKVTVGDQHLTRGADDAARLSRVGLDCVPCGYDGLRRHGGCQGVPRALHVPRRLVALLLHRGAPYFPMRDKLAQVQADCCEFVDLVTREERPEQGGRAPCFTER